MDVVLHLAGIVRRDPGAGESMRRVHVDGTRHVCEAALAHGRPRVIVASSSGTIAVSRKPVIHDESAPYATEVAAPWPYYLSKIEQERLAFSYHEERGLDVVVLNPSILFGPGDARRSSTGDVRNFLERKVPSVPSGGLNFVDARDAAHAFVSAIDRGRSGRRYLIGGPNLTIREFFALLERVSGVAGPKLQCPEWLARTGAAVLRKAMALGAAEFPLDDASIEMAYRFWYCSSERAASELGFRPRPGIDTLRETVSFIRSEEAARDEIRG
jgi:dihydroflavonol-4-reductase